MGDCFVQSMWIDITHRNQFCTVGVMPNGVEVAGRDTAATDDAESDFTVGYGIRKTSHEADFGWVAG